MKRLGRYKEVGIHTGQLNNLGNITFLFPNNGQRYTYDEVNWPKFLLLLSTKAQMAKMDKCYKIVMSFVIIFISTLLERTNLTDCRGSNLRCRQKNCRLLL